MISKMKKYTFLAYHKEYDRFLKDLRDLGLVHVVEDKLNAEKSEHLQRFQSQWKRLSTTQKTLQKFVDKKNPIPANPISVERAYALPDEIQRIENEKSSILQKIQVAKKEREQLQPWGDFDPESIHKLECEGYHFHFFSVPERNYNPEWEKLYNAVAVNTLGSKVYFVTVSREEDILEKLGLDAEPLPEVSISQLSRLIDELNDELQENEKRMKLLTADLPSVEQALQSLQSDIDYTRVHESALKTAEDKVLLLQGWAPVDNEKEIVDYLESKSVYYEVAEPTAEDDVPIKFKNNRFSRLFEPIAEMYMLPKYNEIDLTPYFAPFYMIFFGLSLGDMGYGAFLLVVAFLVKRFMKSKLDNSTRGILSLVQILGASTMVCGLLTGGFFGFNLYDINTPFVQALKNKAFFDNNKMFILSLVLGVVQILFGMILKIANRIKQQGFASALSTIGWFVFLVSIIAAVLMPKAMPLFGTIHWIIAVPALILIFFFNSPGKNPFLNLGTGLWDTYNMATGLLGDVLSYVRLFALGLSGGILASVFNSLADGMSPDIPIVKPIVFLLIFLIGHAINIFMNVLGAIVHPVRLTFVEFYKNAEFEGGGKKYSPFKK